MIQKKSLYIIESTSDRPTEKVRGGSTVRLSDGTNEWITLEDWSSGVFSDVEKYSPANVIGVFQTKKSLSAGKSFNVSIDGHEGIYMVVEIVSTVNDKMYIAAFTQDNKDVILSNGVVYASFDYAGNLLEIANTGTTTDIFAFKISIISSNDDFSYDNISVGGEYTSTHTADEGYNDEIATNKTNASNNTSNIASNTLKIASNTSNISALIAKQSQTDYTTGISLTADATGNVTDVEYCRISRSKYISAIQAKIAFAITGATTSLQVQFPFSVPSSIEDAEILNGVYFEGTGLTYNIKVLTRSPISVEVQGYTISSGVSSNMIFDFSLLGSW